MNVNEYFYAEKALEGKPPFQLKPRFELRGIGLIRVRDHLVTDSISPSWYTTHYWSSLRQSLAYHLLNEAHGD